MQGDLISVNAYKNGLSAAAAERRTERAQSLTEVVEGAAAARSATRMKHATAVISGHLGKRRAVALAGLHKRLKRDAETLADQALIGDLDALFFSEREAAQIKLTSAVNEAAWQHAGAAFGARGYLIALSRVYAATA